MSTAIVIEVRGETAGIVVGSTGNFRFFSSQVPFDALNRKTFRSVKQASRAASVHRAERTLSRAA